MTPVASPHRRLAQVTQARSTAAALALRWHARTGTLIALTAMLTLAGTLPALALLGGSAAAPSLTLALGDTSRLLADWGGRGVAWTQLQQLSIQQLLGVMTGAVALLLFVGIATLLALHLARSASRHGEVVVARSVGASRRDILGATLLEAAALAIVALFIGTLLALVASTALRAAWPGHMASADLALSAAGAFAVTAMVLAGPLLLVRALSTSRLVNDDRRPLTLLIPAAQLGAALVVLSGGISLHRLLGAHDRALDARVRSTTLVQDVTDDRTDRLARAQRFAAFLDKAHQAHPGTLVSIASSGFSRGLGMSAVATVDCGNRCTQGVAVRGRGETASHHAVSSDSFALYRMHLIAGRLLTDRDRWDAPLVAVINQTMARSLFPNGDAVGQRLQSALLANRWFEIIGVVSDAPALGLGSVLVPKLAVYVSILQQPVSLVDVSAAPAAFPADAVRDIGTPRGTPATVRARLATESRALAWFSLLLAGMGALTAIIALGGLVSMLALWLDSLRTELGIRRAVGASRRDVHLLVQSRAALVALGGALFGVWLGQIGWDVFPKVFAGAPTIDWTVSAATGGALGVLTLVMAWLVTHRFVRTPVQQLLIEL